MRRALILAGPVLALILVLLWATGGFAALQAAVLEAQRGAQSTLAQAVRALRQGQPGALAGLLAVSFGYGVLHAAGPGHGKLLIGSYGAARRVTLLRLSALAAVSSLAQSAVAVALVLGATALIGLTRQETQAVAEDWLQPAGTAALGALGLWIAWRGLRALRSAPHAAHHHHDHHHDHDGAQCGHAHGPSLDQVQALQGWRDGAALVAGIAMRPCSGALFLMILCWQLGITAAGVAGVFAMGLGTALVTGGVALAAVWTREGVLAGAGHRAARLLPWVELSAGATLAAVAFALLGRGL